VSAPIATIQEYIMHRARREQQLVEIMKSHPSTEFSGWDLVARMYPTIVSDVKYAALQNAVLHVEKLVRDGLVTCVHSYEENNQSQLNPTVLLTTNNLAWEANREYGEHEENTTEMVQRKSNWRWKWREISDGNATNPL
jgi:hypothetical protein